MASSDIQIASNSLQLLGHSSISAFDEGTAGAEIAAALYDITYEATLTEYRWRFATKKVQLARLTGTPIDDYIFQYQLPADLLYLIRTTRGNLNYELYEDKLHTNDTEVIIDYIFKIPADRLPAYYVSALQFLLASQFALPITGSESKAQLYFGMYQSQLRKARHTDATQRPNRTFEDDPYGGVRFGHDGFPDGI